MDHAIRHVYKSSSFSSHLLDSSSTLTRLCVYIYVVKLVYLLRVEGRDWRVELRLPKNLHMLRYVTIKVYKRVMGRTKSSARQSWARYLIFEKFLGNVIIHGLMCLGEVEIWKRREIAR